MILKGGHQENSDDYRLAVFKAQIGEPCLGILIFSLSFFCFFFFFFLFFHHFSCSFSETGTQESKTGT